MSGYTENQIVIFKDADHVFELTNRIDLWPKLFTEYQSAEILSQDDNVITFRLTTFPEGERPSRTWTSVRTILREENKAIAKRLEPAFPFEYMNIKWLYEPLPSNDGVIMTWIQEFNVHSECPFTNEQMESFLNANTRKQMVSVKKNVENWQGAI
jgi:aromatase